MISKEMFVNRVAFDNPWWRSNRINEEYSAVKPRKLMSEIFSQLTDWSLHRALILLGPRRVGKTWLMQHLVAKILSENIVLAKQIIFLSIDVPVYHGAGLEELIYNAAEVSGADVKNDRLVVLFDEIQYLKDWEQHLKTLADAYPNIRFMASGSAASAIARGSMESGAGRFTDIKLGPLSFAEFLEISEEDGGLSLDSVVTADGEYDFPAVESMERINKLFLEYVNFGGYPELVLNRAVKSNPIQFIQRDIVDKVLLRDLPSMYHIEDVRELQSFFSYLSFHSGMIQSWETLSQGSGLRKQQIAAFVRYLEEAFLIIKHDRIDITAASLQRATQFKLYLTNPSLRASMFQPIMRDDDPYLGYAVETAISSQFGIDEHRNAWRYANWKIGKTQGEVDFVRIHPGTQRPDAALEIKWSDGPFDHPAELKEAVNFCEKNSLKRLWVTTRTQKGVKKFGNIELVYIPTALFALAINRRLMLK